ncbi:hypothetical protein ACET3X_004911 [Alternaria dauci]|uniref:Uncharacterized protein n=1 Tax=Alternaria dauci TaxID=48095 RepID=A0ABR3ULG1_9PLEO
MWAFKVLTALFGLVPWFESTSNIEAVVVTQLVLQAPLILPTVTVTKTVGVPATAITHTIPTTSTTATPKSSRPRLNPYKFSSPDHIESRYRAQDRVSTAHAMAVPQYSKLDFAVFLVTIFAVTIMAWWVTVFAMGKGRAMRSLGHVVPAINASFRHTGCRIGYAGLLLGWICLLTDYWFEWSEGYIVWPRVFSTFVSYPLVLTFHSQLPLVKRIPLLCWRFVKMVVNGVGQWFARQAHDWYEGRTSKRRIDKIFERHISVISSGECLFPDLYGAYPNPATWSQIVKAMATDILFFGWNLTIVVIKLRIRSWKQIIPHMLDIFRVTLQVCFGLGEEEVSWKLWKAGYVTFLKGVCAVLSVVFELLKTFLCMIWVTLEVVKAVLAHSRLRYWTTGEAPVSLKKTEAKVYADKVHNAYCETAMYDWERVAVLYLSYQAALEDRAAAHARIDDVVAFYSAISQTIRNPEFLDLLNRANRLYYRRGQRNPFSILAKCAQVNVRAVGIWGPQIEDVSEAIDAKFIPFERDEIVKFIAGMQFGASPIRPPTIAPYPEMSEWTADPFPTDPPAPLSIDLPLTRNFA